MLLHSSERNVFNKPLIPLKIGLLQYPRKFLNRNSLMRLNELVEFVGTVLQKKDGYKF